MEPRHANTLEPIRYVLVTPARDEAAFIERTIQSIIAQTVLPLRWVIVSDGSTDATEAIVEKYTPQYPWITLVRMPNRRERHFGGKVEAFNAGYQALNGMNYDFIGNLDGDLSLGADYFEYLLEKLAKDPRLGVVGTNYMENGTLKYDFRFTNIEDVAGACQLFRRRCFEQIGGYKPNRDGGVDLFATLSARMCGWQTRTFTDKSFLHHRPSGTAKVSRLLVEYHNGRKDYCFGCHPLWQPFRALYRLTKRPWIIGGCLLLIGYFWAMLTRTPKCVSKDIARFRRLEQMRRLRQFFRNLMQNPLKFLLGVGCSSSHWFESLEKPLSML